jgi:hypothetical protein
VGLWAAYAVIRSGESGEAADGWFAGAGTAEGWSGFVSREAEPHNAETPWPGVRGTMLTAVVMDSDVALLVGWDEGGERFRWLFNEEAGPAYGLPGRAEEPDEATQAAERAPVVAAMVGWARATGFASDPAVLDDILARGYVFAEEGLYAALAAIGVVESGGVIQPAAPIPSTMEEALERLRHPEPQTIDLASGEANLLPLEPRPMFLAAALDTTGEAWHDFVIEHELEFWGRPGCLVAYSWQEVPAGGLTSHGMWAMVLASDPPVSVTMWMGPLGTDLWFLPITGPWHVVPEEYADLSSAIAWARENVGTVIEPVHPDHETFETELAEQDLGIDLMNPSPLNRSAAPPVVAELFTYVDLADRADVLTAWLDQARRLLIDPVIAAAGDRAYFPGGDDEGRPYGIPVTLGMKSAKGRWSHVGGDPARWRSALDRLSTGELHYLSIDLDQLNGTGLSSHYRGHISIAVELRDQFTEATGPLPDKHPARIVITVAQQLLGADGLTHIRTLMRNGALAFDAVTGYVHGSGGAGSMQSPYERRLSTEWEGERLDAMSRGMHWGNLIGAGHLAALGGPGRLQQLLADGRIQRLDRWSEQPELWWFELPVDPLGACNAYAATIAADLPEIMPG